MSDHQPERDDPSAQVSQAADDPELIPMSTRIWNEGRSGGITGGQDPVIWLDGLQAAEVGVELIGKVTREPAFRSRLQRDPIGALGEIGIALSDETEKRLRVALKEEPDFMTKAMGDQYNDLLAKDGVSAAIPAVVVGVQVVKYVGVVVAVGTTITSDTPDDSSSPAAGGSIAAPPRPPEDE